MYREIRRLFADVGKRRPDVHAVVLAPEGPHFCAGNDLDEFMTMDGDNARERMFDVREAFYAIQGCAVPVIGAVHGAALGTGLAIAASCDFVVASADARFGLPELTVGVLGAEEMAQVGAIAEVVPREELLATAQQMAAEVARHSPTAIRVGSTRLTGSRRWT
jgi:enoyl-CoA hydratase